MKKIIVGCLIAVGLVTGAGAMDNRDRDFDRHYLELKAAQGVMESINEKCNGFDTSISVGASTMKLNLTSLLVEFPHFYKQIQLNYNDKKAVKIFFARPTISDLDFLKSIYSKRMFKEEGYALNGTLYYIFIKTKKATIFNKPSKLITDIACYNNMSANKYYGHNGREYVEVLFSISIGNFDRAIEIIRESKVVKKTIPVLPWTKGIVDKYNL